MELISGEQHGQSGRREGPRTRHDRQVRSTQIGPTGIDAIDDRAK